MTEAEKTKLISNDGMEKILESLEITLDELQLETFNSYEDFIKSLNLDK